ncbi:hypothetical protein RJ640_006111 [Escallonia rubra]|uniref:BAHD acyltransferase n=1 Tax=Escallonia rubra TaxID=112253 RepID=A0AA88U9Q0_9ASTE|nr:hypothetical protein RJ640_006111 [Escallonia rubra]
MRNYKGQNTKRPFAKTLCSKYFTVLRFRQHPHYAGHHKPIAAVQVTELGDAVFIGCTVNHAVVDGTSFWNFFNTFAEVCKGVKTISKSPNFRRNCVFNSLAVLPVPADGPAATFSGDEPLRERILHFSREAILKMKFRANNPVQKPELHSLFSLVPIGDSTVAACQSRTTPG